MEPQELQALLDPEATPVKTETMVSQDLQDQLVQLVTEAHQVHLVNVDSRACQVRLANPENQARMAKLDCLDSLD